jgi:hypothetical protein
MKEVLSGDGNGYEDEEEVQYALEHLMVAPWGMRDTGCGIRDARCEI